MPRFMPRLPSHSTSSLSNPVTKRLTKIVVRRLTGSTHRALLQVGHVSFVCSIGKKGITHQKREGDGATPATSSIRGLRILKVYYRPDRLPRPHTLLPVATLKPSQGWCDEPLDRNYNRPVTLPYPASHEALWRDDPVYNIVLDLSWNRSPIRKGHGSAIFMHLCERDRGGTAGCIAMPLKRLRILLQRIGLRTHIVIV
jgi:L,D-peptidoglycan transpeptidase YkuD (ErfK/YbiS/YcfS/YnhG family)